MTQRDVNHTDDSTADCEAFRVRSAHREHPPIPTMTGRYSFEATVRPLMTNSKAQP